MKTILSISILLLWLPAAPIALAAEQTATFSVENMTCASCRHIVSRSMSSVDGVLRVDVSYKDRRATVTYDDTQTTLEKIAEASTANGYLAAPNRPAP